MRRCPHRRESVLCHMNGNIGVWAAVLVRISACWDPIQALHKRKIS